MKIFETGELIGKTSRLLTNSLSKQLLNSNAGITSEQWILLQILVKGAKNQKELGEITSKSKGTINSLISYLLKSKLILKTVSSTDKRNTEISISKKGLLLIEESNLSALKSIKQATEGFSDNEIQELNNYLIRIQINLIKQ